MPRALPSLLSSNRTDNHNRYAYWESLLRVLESDDWRSAAQLFEADMKVSFDEKVTEIRAHREAWTKSRKQTQARRASAPVRWLSAAAPRAFCSRFTRAKRAKRATDAPWSRSNSTLCFRSRMMGGACKWCRARPVACRRLGTARHGTGPLRGMALGHCEAWHWAGHTGGVDYDHDGVRQAEKEATSR